MPGHIALHEPTDFFKALLETTQEGYWYIDNSLIGRDVNPALCRLLGRSRDDIIGRSIYDFVDEYNASVFRREIARRKHGTGSSYEITFSRPDGTDVHYLNNATPVFDETGEKVGSIGLWTDITRIKNIERELRISSRDLQRTAVDTDSKLAEAVRKLRRTEQHFHALMDNTPGAISLKDIEGRFYMVNRRYEEVFNIKAADILGKTVLEVYPERNMNADLALEAAAIRNVQSVTEERIAVTDEGPNRRLMFTKFPIIASSGKVTGVGTTIVDVTAMREAEQHTAQMQKMDSLGTLSGGIAHEINNLLQPIMGLSELTAMDLPEGSQGRKNLKFVLDNAETIEALVQKILSFSRMERNPSRKKADLTRITQEQTDLITATHPATIDLYIDVCREPLIVEIDETRIKQVLLNLYSNGVDALEGNVGRITCRLAKVSIGGMADRDTDVPPGEYAKLTVSDTGKGMDAQTQRRIFEPFFTTKEVGAGTGMGLSMIHGIVSSHKGSIEVSTTDGKGTTFDVYLPLSDDSSLPIITDEGSSITHG